MPRTLTFEYDLLYRKTADIDDASLGTPITAWSYFGPNRVAEVQLGNGLISSCLNDARINSAVQSNVPLPAWGNANTDRVGYDGTARMIAKRYVQNTTFGSSSSSSSSSSSGEGMYGSLVAGFTTAYDKSSNKNYERMLHAESRSSLYPKIDSVNRLGQSVRGVLSQGITPGSAVLKTPNTLPGTETTRNYKLDPLGNWQRTYYSRINPAGSPTPTTDVKEVRQHNPLNQITSVADYEDDILTGQAAFIYDKNGNLLDDGVRLFAYDAFNRLVRVKRKSDGDTIAVYVYDAAGRRIRKQIQNGGLSGDLTNTTTDYLYSGDRVMEERSVGTGSDLTSKQYVWGRYVDELIQQRNYPPAGGASGGTDYYLLSDTLYRANALTDSSGTVVEAYDEDVFGQTIIYSAPGVDGKWFTDDDVQLPADTFPKCEVLFTGQRYDAETELYCYRNRTYNPSLGRFLQRDPVGYSVPAQTTLMFVDVQGSLDCLGVYQYTFNNPSQWLDPYGWGTIGGGGGGGGSTGGGGGGGDGGGAGGTGQTTGNTTWCQLHPILCALQQLTNAISSALTSVGSAITSTGSWIKSTWKSVSQFNSLFWYNYFHPTGWYRTGRNIAFAIAGLAGGAALIGAGLVGMIGIAGAETYAGGQSILLLAKLIGVISGMVMSSFAIAHLMSPNNEEMPGSVGDILAIVLKSIGVQPNISNAVGAIADIAAGHYVDLGTSGGVHDIIDNVRQTGDNISQQCTH